jgi:DoxX
MGFPIPVALALWITFNESIGPFLVACGFLTRLAAASLAHGMAGALYTSVRLGGRLAESRALRDYLRRLEPNGSRQAFLGRSSQAQEVASHEKVIGNSTFYVNSAGFLLIIADSSSRNAISFSSARTT